MIRYLILAVSLACLPLTGHADDSATVGGATNVVLTQRAASPPYRRAAVSIKGNSYPFHAIGFNGSGILGPLDVLTQIEWTAAEGVLAVAAALKAPLASPALTGTPTAPTATTGTATTQLATTAFASSAVAAAIAVESSARSTALAAGLLQKASIDHVHLALDIADSTAIGRALLLAADQAAVQAIVGAGDVGTTKFGSQASLITTNPYSPTWTTQDAILYYGATGQVNLPAAGGYTNKTLIVWPSTNWTITVSPGVAGTIIVNGASLGTGIANVVSTTGGAAFAYLSDGASWIKLEGGGGGGGASSPWTQNIDGAGFDLLNVQTITANEFIGDGSGLSLLSGSQLTGTTPDGLIFGKITTSRSNVATPIDGVSNVVVTSDAETSIILDAATEILTYSEEPPTGTYFRYTLEGHTVDCLVTIPSTYSFASGGLRTSFTALANRPTSVVVRRGATRYVMWGDPLTIGDLPLDSTPATSAKIEIDQGNGSEHSTIAEIISAAGGTATGSWASPYTTASTLSPTWTGPLHAVYIGVAQTVALPDAAAYANRGIIIYAVGAFGLTVDPDADDFIVREGTAQADGVTVTISSGSGNFLCLISDGANWITLGYKGTLAVGS